MEQAVSNLTRHPKIIFIPFSSIFKIETHIEETDSTQWQRVSCDTISGKSCVSYRMVWYLLRLACFCMRLFLSQMRDEVILLRFSDWNCKEYTRKCWFEVKLSQHQNKINANSENFLSNYRHGMSIKILFSSREE